ncbi:MAG: glycosyltransferase [Rivularia sp. (in: cyanobacteria)]
MKPIAIITPWFGKDLKGGAEQQAWQVATRLAKLGHNVEVLTTCCNSFFDDWGVNHKKADVSKHSVSECKTIKIRHFKVDRRNHDSFNQVNSLMLSLASTELKPGVNPVSPQEAAIFCEENINSTQLLDFLKNHQQQYHGFLFIPYLYGLILNGLPIVRDRAFLQPCLHDEVYAYLPQVAKIFHQAKGLFFNSEGEAKLANKLYGAGIIPKSHIVGEGVEVSLDYNANLTDINNFSVKKERFIFCLGRRDATKNTDFLVKCYAAFKHKHPDSNLKLVLAGPGTVSFDNCVEGLIDLGLVSETDKKVLLVECLALFQPSRNESYSRVIMEAWFYGKPVVAHQNCLATAIAVENCGGGWLAQTESEWAELFATVDRLEEKTLTVYGTNGRSYAQENAVWDKVIERYETALGLSETSTEITTKPSLRKLKEIHQLLPNLAYGDAISNHALAIRNYLRKCGYKSDIFVQHLDCRIVKEACVFNPKSISHKAGLIYHHSIGSELTKYAISHPTSKCLIYHNITPAKFFQPYRPEFAKILEQGRQELKQLAKYFPLSVGDSAYNATELIESGFSQPGVLPIVIDPSKWDIPADAELMHKLQDGKTNLLFVGRLAPNKRQDDLIEAFAHYLTMDCNARLILVGYSDPQDPYYYHLKQTIEKLNLTNHIVISGQVNDAQLLAYYRTAHLFWSTSEHEGFCVPLVESMWFDIPILAYKSSAVPETLGRGGIIFTTKHDLIQVAAIAKVMLGDRNLQSKIINAQRLRRNYFLVDNVYEKLSNLVMRMETLCE